ncbi:MAG TPA: PAS domain S-box protein, partial [Candidatus Xenobia bacterium]
MIILDAEEAARQKAERARVFNVVEVPTLRLVGYTLILFLIWARSAYEPMPLLDDAGLLWELTAALVLYMGASWLLLRHAPARLQTVLGDVLMACDLGVYAVIIYLTGAERSWLWVLMLARVADQTATSFNRVLRFAHVASACYLAMLVVASNTMPGFSWSNGLTKLLTLYAVSLYLALTARTAENLRRQAVAAIQVAREQLAARTRLTEILEKTSDIIATSTLDGRGVYLNRAGRAVVDMEPNAALNPQEPLAIWGPPELERLRTEIIPEVLRDGQWTGSLMVQTGDGVRVPSSAVIITHGSHDGSTRFISCILRDITYLVETQRRVERLARLQELILGSAQDAIFSLDTQGHCTLINPAALKVLNCSGPDLAGLHMHDIV